MTCNFEYNKYVETLFSLYISKISYEANIYGGNNISEEVSPILENYSNSDNVVYTGDMMDSYFINSFKYLINSGSGFDVNKLYDFCNDVSHINFSSSNIYSKLLKHMFLEPYDEIENTQDDIPHELLVYSTIIGVSAEYYCNYLSCDETNEKFYKIYDVYKKGLKIFKTRKKVVISDQIMIFLFLNRAIAFLRQESKVEFVKSIFDITSLLKSFSHNFINLSIIDYANQLSPKEFNDHDYDIIIKIIDFLFSLEIPKEMLSVSQKKIIDYNHVKLSKSKYIFCIGMNEGETVRYKVLNAIESLSDNNVDAVFCTLPELEKLINIAANLSAVIFLRCGNCLDYYKNVSLLKAIGKTIIYETDDLVFDYDAVQSWETKYTQSKDVYASLEKDVFRYQNAIACADVFIGTNEYFNTQFIQDINIEFKTSENTLSKLCYKLYDVMYINKDKRIKKIKTMGYFSGTDTHSKEVKLINSSIHSSVDVIYPKNIKPYFSYLKSIYDVDAVLAPLTNSNFNSGKSLLKAFEGFMFDKPVITNSDSIYYNKYKNYKPCIDFKEFNDNFQFDMDEFNVLKSERSYRQINEYLYSYVSYKNKIYNIEIIASDYERNSGGSSNIVRLANALVLDGHKVTIRYLDSLANCSDLCEIIRNDFPWIGFNISVGEIKSRDKDIYYISTFWKTMEVMQNLDLQHRTIYYVQDFEPWFYPYGEEYFRCLNTYKKACMIVTYSDFMKSILSTHTSAEIYHVDPVLEKTYYLNHNHIRERAFALYYKPSNNRRLSSFLLDCFLRSNAQNFGFKLYLFGYEHAPVHKSVVNMGVLSKEGLGQLFNSVMYGMCASFTNPSGIPLEMLSSGVHVLNVDTDYSRSYSQSLSNDLISVSPNEDSIIEKINYMCENSPSNPAVLSRNFPDDVLQMKQFSRAIVRFIEGGSI